MRRLTADVLPQLPRKRQVVVPVALGNEREYRLAEKDVIAWLREQPLDLSELDRRVAAALRAERLAQLNALKRLAARGKLGPALSRGSTTSWRVTSRSSCSAAIARSRTSCSSASRTPRTCSAATPPRRARTRCARSRRTAARS